MSLTDIMSNADLATYPLVAMVLFLGVFTIVGFRCFKRNASHDASMASMPLEDESR